MEFLIISGLSGAGKSRTASTLEDFGYYCVDNMPAELIPQLARLCLDGRYEKVALVIDSRGGQDFDRFFDALKTLDDMGCKYSILFIEASDEAIIIRYKETRHRHPLTIDGTDLTTAIQKERLLLQPIREISEQVIDTTALSTIKLRGELARLFAQDQKNRAMSVNVMSFGFKYGIPIDADIVLDVRFLPNPYYVNELKPLSGLDDGVRDFIFASSQTTVFIQKLEDMLEFVLPLYVDEGKSSLVIAVGCTGGRHRSVAVAKAVGDFIKNHDFVTVTSHRDISRG